MNRFDQLSRSDRRAAMLHGFDLPQGRSKAWERVARYETEALYEDHAIAGTPIYPVSNNGSQFTGTVDMSKFARCQFLCVVGTLGAGGNFLFQLQQTNNSNGVTNVNITGASQSPVLSLGNVMATASQIARIEIRSDQMTRRYVQCAVIGNGTNAGIPSCFPMASEARQHPQGGTSTDLSYPTIVTA